MDECSAYARSTEGRAGTTFVGCPTEPNRGASFAQYPSHAWRAATSIYSSLTRTSPFRRGATHAAIPTCSRGSPRSSRILLELPIVDLEKRGATPHKGQNQILKSARPRDIAAHLLEVLVAACVWYLAVTNQRAAFT